MSASDRRLIVTLFDDAAVYPGGAPALETASLGIYQVLWWYQSGLLHVNEANELLKPTWSAKAKRAEQYLANQLGVSPTAVPTMLDRMMQLPRWQKPTGGPMQRNNPLGNGLRTLVAETLRRWGDERWEYLEEQPATAFFPGMQMPGRSTTPKIDIVAQRKTTGHPQAIISCKWSIRHDRISDPTNECQEYKGAATRRQMMGLYYCVVTNEMYGQRLDKVITQPCVDSLIHVHLPLAELLNDDDGMAALENAKTTGRLLDLVELVELTHRWP